MNSPWIGYPHDFFNFWTEPDRSRIHTFADTAGLLGSSVQDLARSGVDIRRIKLLFVGLEQDSYFFLIWLESDRNRIPY